ncbi:MAG: nicotinamide-nucleotide amidohydrolase family protein [Verrucomicrobiota bacterium]
MTVGVASQLKTLLVRDPLLTISVAESLTAGHVQARLASVSGSSAYFLGGITAYSLEQKVKQLGVRRALAAPVNCVSPAVAVQMARGVAVRFGSDLALATTGYAEPDAEWKVDEPFACWAIARRLGPQSWDIRTGRLVCAGMKRAEVQACVADAVLGELLVELTRLRG